MAKLIAISPVGRNGQTIVPAVIRRMFKIGTEHNLVTFYLEGKHVEIVPVNVQKAEIDYTEEDLTRIKHLAKGKGGSTFRTAQAAKKHLKEL